MPIKQVPRARPRSACAWRRRRRATRAAASTSQQAERVPRRAATAAERAGPRPRPPALGGRDHGGEAGQQRRSRPRDQPDQRSRGRTASSRTGCESPPPRMKSTGQRFSVTSRRGADDRGESPSTPSRPARARDGEPRGGGSAADRQPLAQRTHTQAAAAPAATAANSGRVSTAEPAATPASAMRPAAQRQQLSSRHRQSEGRGVGVGKDEIERRARERDREQHSGRQARHHRREPLTRQRVERARGSRPSAGSRTRTPR